jgi:hypothetical protein
LVAIYSATLISPTADNPLRWNENRAWHAGENGLRKGILTGILALVLWVVLAAGTYYGWIHGTDHRDFYPRWAGARLALFEGRDLYSDETTRAMQIMLYGQERPPNIDPQAFAYPAIIVPMLLPFWFIPDVEIATAAWEATSVLILAGTLLLVRNTWSNAPRWVVPLMLLWYYVILMIFQAQITAIPLASVGLGYWAYVRKRDVLAGAIMTIGFIKPEQVIIPIAFLLIASLYRQRPRVLISFIATGLILLLASVLIAGWWVGDWIDALGRYAGYAPTNWSLTTLWNIHPLAITLLFGYIVFMIARMRLDSNSLVAAGVCIGLLLLPQTLIWGLTMLIFPLTMAWRGSARWLALATWLTGWLLIFGAGINEWWRVQSLLLPALALLAVVVASRQPVKPPQARPAVTHERML